MYVKGTQGKKAGSLGAFPIPDLKEKSIILQKLSCSVFYKMKKEFKIYLTLFNNPGEDLNILKIYRREIFLCYFIFQDYLGT
jgi:hypothetical protein